MGEGVEHCETVVAWEGRIVGLEGVRVVVRVGLGFDSCCSGVEGMRTWSDGNCVEWAMSLWS